MFLPAVAVKNRSEVREAARPVLLSVPLVSGDVRLVPQGEGGFVETVQETLLLERPDLEPVECTVRAGHRRRREVDGDPFPRPPRKMTDQPPPLAGGEADRQ